MPKLLIFAPCEKIIIAEDGGVSLINIMQGLKADVPSVETADKLADDVHVVIQWFIYSFWERSEGDDDATFELSYLLTHPNRDEALLAKGAMGPFSKSFHRHTTKLSTFPVKQEGVYTLSALVRRSDDVAPPAIAGTYPITLTHRITAPAATR